jgi:hypothetical protein
MCPPQATTGVALAVVSLMVICAVLAVGKL